MFSNGDYLNYYDLNNVEVRIEQLTSFLQQKTDISDYQKKVWVVNEFPYIQEIDRIEKGIDKLGVSFYKTSDWIATKVWLNEENKSLTNKSFSYQDINRWLYNLNLIDKIKNEDCTVWNGQSFLYWNEPNDLEWEE